MIGTHAEMSRDFTPDFDDFREPSPGPPEASRPSPDAGRSPERTRGETPRPEARSVYVREPRPKDVPRGIREPSCTTATGVMTCANQKSRPSRTWANFESSTQRI